MAKRGAKRSAQKEVNQTELAALIGRTTRQIRNLEAEGLPHRAEGNGKFYPIPAALEWFYARKFEPEVQSSADELKLRRLKAETEMQEIELAKLRGELVHIDDVEAELRGPLEAVDAALRNAPARHAAALAAAAKIKTRTARTLLEDIIEPIREDLRHIGDEDGDDAESTAA